MAAERVDWLGGNRRRFRIRKLFKKIPQTVKRNHRDRVSYVKQNSEITKSSKSAKFGEYKRPNNELNGSDRHGSADTDKFANAAVGFKPKAFASEKNFS